MAKEVKKQTILDLYSNEGALLKRVHQYLIAGNSNQARTLIEDYNQARRDRRAKRESSKPKEVKKVKKQQKPEITKEIAIQIVKSIDENFDERVRSDLEDLRTRSNNTKSIKEVADYDRAMKKRKELKEKFDI